MFGTGEMLVLVVVLLALVFGGVHIAVALGFAAVLGIYLMTGRLRRWWRSFLASTAYEAVRDYVFAVIPLFMLMGEFLAKCGAATRPVLAVQPADAHRAGPARRSRP